LTVPEKRSKVKSAKKRLFILRVNQNHRHRLHHCSTKLRENFFLRLQSHIQRIGNNILFSSTDKELFLSPEKKGKLRFLVKKKEIASFCAAATITPLLLYLFSC